MPHKFAFHCGRQPNPYWVTRCVYFLMMCFEISNLGNRLNCLPASLLEHWKLKEMQLSAAAEGRKVSSGGTGARAKAGLCSRIHGGLQIPPLSYSVLEIAYLWCTSTSRSRGQLSIFHAFHSTSKLGSCPSICSGRPVILNTQCKRILTTSPVASQHHRHKAGAAWPTLGFCWFFTAFSPDLHNCAPLCKKIYMPVNAYSF